MITYNHEPYIAQAIEGVLMQKTDFPIEIIIGEDCSTDNTRVIVKEYAEKYPNIIVAQLPDKNRGMKQNFEAVLHSAKGKYIALCEGDDYWIDSMKLQIQISYLEENSTCFLCCHNSEVLLDDNRKKIFSRIKKSRILTEKELINNWIIPTCSIVIRNGNWLNFPSWSKQIYSSDQLLILMAMNMGDVFFINRNMAVYRFFINTGSMSSKMKNKIVFVNRQIYYMLSMFNIETNYKYSKLIAIKHNNIKNGMRLMLLRNRRKLLVSVFFMTKYVFMRMYYKINTYCSNSLN
ncbi:glycosyltransferase [uncultured Acetobacteroides sp.]|uniref:glycosyltransferase n=1 Tax=uncultured Acetobacteroides sp. TaxID=1760811 RepID=UPI0029F46732|nr:glycosyltransferase [uncultured Acetobacteroides sp.]